MNKALKKYAKTKWIYTRLSKPSKIRFAFKKMQLGMMLAVSSQQINTIKSCNQPKVAKSLAIAEIIIKTNQSIINMIGGKNHA